MLQLSNILEKMKERFSLLENEAVHEGLLSITQSVLE
jgi:hypothetical protein